MDRIAERICIEYESGDLAYDEAVDELVERCGYSHLDAELIISELEVDSPEELS